MLVALSFKVEHLIYGPSVQPFSICLGTRRYAPEDMPENVHSSVVRGRKSEKCKCLLRRMNDFDLFPHLNILKQ